MQGRVVGGWWSRSGSSTPTTSCLSKSRKQELLRRLMVTKAANRAAVHGAKLPATDAIKVCFLIYFLGVEWIYINQLLIVERGSGE